MLASLHEVQTPPLLYDPGAQANAEVGEVQAKALDPQA